MADLRKIETVKEILGGLAIFLGCLALIGMCLAINYMNSQKVQNMTRLCLEQGYNTWDSTDGGRSGCVK